MFGPTVFPLWRDVWTRLDDVAPLLVRAEALVRRRFRGNYYLPKNMPSGVRGWRELLALLREWTTGQVPASARSIAAKSLYDGLAPIARAARWPRFLLLERSLADGSETGDLLFAALALRTLCEEVQRQHALDLDERAIRDFAESSDDRDVLRLNLYFQAVREVVDSGEDPRQASRAAKTAVDGVNWLPDLLAAKQALNDYVHPNYGSHIAALYPEQSLAPRVLLEGVVAAYEAFFALSWAEERLNGAGTLPKLSPVKSWRKTVRRFISDVPRNMREATEQAIKSGQLPSDASGILDLPSVVKWLEAEHAGARELLASPEVSLLLDPLRRPEISDGGPRFAHDRYRIWDGATDADLLGIALARRAEQILAEKFPDGAPHRNNQKEWLTFIGFALQLAMTLNDVKIASFRTQLARQMVIQNPFGIVLCVRSIIENKAVGNWLAIRLAAHWSDLGKRVKPGASLPEPASKLEEDIARFLTGTKGSLEEDLPWTQRESHERWSVQLSLPDMITKAFQPEDRLVVCYNVASAALHGRLWDSLSLISHQDTLGRTALRFGALVLERASDHDEQMASHIPAFRLFLNLLHAAEVSGTENATSEGGVKATFGLVEGKLKLGRDYTGDGTRENPFRIRSHLQFHPTSARLLEQLGITVSGQRELRFQDDVMCDCYPTAKGEVFFVVSSVAGLSKA